MKYWAFLTAKFAVAAGVLLLLRRGILALLPRLEHLFYSHPEPFAREFLFTFAMLFFSLLGAGVVWLIVLDQRYRCRTCLRRLRMPIRRGSWNHVLLGAPTTEYICLFGHGTLTVAELQLTGYENPDWAPHDDIWTELYALDEKK
jgi:hypothetical protein